MEDLVGAGIMDVNLELFLIQQQLHRDYIITYIPTMEYAHLSNTLPITVKPNPTLPLCPTTHHNVSVMI